MIYLKHYHFVGPLSTENYLLKLAELPERLQSQVNAYKRWEDRHCSLFGKLLLKEFLEDFSKSFSLEDLVYSPQHKPSVKGFFNFNISHSANRVVCAVSTNGRAGVDIERNDPLDYTEFESSFSAEEYHNIQSSPQPLFTFYSYWTRKEAAMKADGRGIQILLNTITIPDDYTARVEGREWFLRKADIDPLFTCYCATEIPDAELIIQDSRITL